MQKKTISSIVMIMVLIPLIIIGGLPFILLAVSVGLGGFYELIKFREVKKDFPFIVKIFAYIITALLIFNNTNSMDLNYVLDYRIMAFIIIGILGPIVFINDNKKYNIQDALYLIGSTLFIGISFNLIILLRNYGLGYLLYLLMITTMTDSFGYLTGGCIGRYKLSPIISPNKTVEGAIGGSLVATIVSSIFYITLINQSANIYFVVIMTLILTLFAQLGDLVFSAIKRYYNTKDFSNLIPGHGGILDRLDSIIFVVLAFIIIIGFL